MAEGHQDLPHQAGRRGLGAACTSTAPAPSGTTLTNIRKPAPAPGRDRRLTADDEKKLLAACDGHFNPVLGWIVRIALHTGMRAGEIKTLRRNRVNLTKRTVHLTETKNGSARTVPLTQAAATAFRHALSNPVRPLDTDLIFFGEPGRDGTRPP